MGDGVGGQFADQQDPIVSSGAVVEKGGKKASYETDLVATAGEGGRAAARGGPGCRWYGQRLAVAHAVIS